MRDNYLSKYWYLAKTGKSRDSDFYRFNMQCEVVKIYSFSQKISGGPIKSYNMEKQDNKRNNKDLLSQRLTE